MEFYEWDESCSVGVQDLDSQHIRILEIISKLSDNLDTSTESELIKDVISEMQEYADEHFEYEERLIEQYRPEQLEDQRKQHKYFVKRVSEYASGTAGRNSVKDIYIFMGSWWLKHILILDMKYKGLIPEDAPAAANTA